MAVVVFGFAVGRFALALRQIALLAERPVPRTGISVGFGVAAIVAGVLLTIAGTLRHRQTRRQLDEGRFEPAGRVVDAGGAPTAVFGLAGYLLYLGFRL